MDIADAINLIKPAFGSPQPGEVWADLGAGSGLFTRALANILARNSSIHAIDKTSQSFEPTLNGSNIFFHQMDFSSDALPPIQFDGILMANSLHFVNDKRGLLLKLQQHLRINGKLLIIEYEREKGNRWVPYPVTFYSLSTLLREVGFEDVTLTGERSSIYGAGNMYACSSIRG